MIESHLKDMSDIEISADFFLSPAAPQNNGTLLFPIMSKH